MICMTNPPTKARKHTDTDRQTHTHTHTHTCILIHLVLPLGCLFFVLECNALQRTAVERFVLERRRRVLGKFFSAWSEHTIAATNKAIRVQARAETAVSAQAWAAWRTQLRAKRRRDALEASQLWFQQFAHLHTCTLTHSLAYLLNPSLTLFLSLSPFD